MAAMLPNARRAAYRASSVSIPSSCSSSASSSRCDRISCRKSASGRFRRQNMPLRLHLLRPQNASDRAGNSTPLTRFLYKLFAPPVCQRVESGFPIFVGGAPFGADPSLFLQSLQSQIKRTVVDEEDLIGLSSNRTRNPLAVLRSKNQNPENQQVKSALKQGSLFAIG